MEGWDRCSITISIKLSSVVIHESTGQRFLLSQAVQEKQENEVPSPIHLGQLIDKPPLTKSFNKVLFHIAQNSVTPCYIPLKS